jgi:ankyrin repeat protein
MSGGDWKEMLTAVERGDLALVRYHLANGVDPNYQHPELLTTPLIMSIECGHAAITELLLALGADPDQPAGFSRDTPWAVARRVRNREAIRLLRPYRKSWLDRLWAGW